MTRIGKLLEINESLKVEESKVSPAWTTTDRREISKEKFDGLLWEMTSSLRGKRDPYPSVNSWSSKGITGNQRYVRNSGFRTIESQHHLESGQTKYFIFNK